ncbi:MAG: DNA mismatch repair protein MutS [Vampirovibrionales bacterium]|nr:DNA mismatch repair protein MutS [Vampirovibrionales bacterium]
MTPETSLDASYQSVCSLTVDLNVATPMLRQFLEIKQNYPGVILLYRMGDFYETFFEDALTAAKVLELTLTGRDGGVLGRVPMAGVPVRAIEGYLTRLLQQNFKVAICEQMEDPAQAKGLVKRQVVRVLSPGTLNEGALLAQDAPNYCMALVTHPAKGKNQVGLIYGLAWVDVSTGGCWAMELAEEDALLGELARLQPAELIVPGKRVKNAMGFDETLAKLPETLMQAVAQVCPCQPTPVADATIQDAAIGETALKQLCDVQTLEGFGLHEAPAAKQAAGVLAAYLKAMFVAEPPRLDGVQWVRLQDAVYISPSARKNLELTQNARDGQVQGSLLGLLNQTCSAMGARQLRRWIEQPSLNVAEITRRHEAIAYFLAASQRLHAVRQPLALCCDLERLSARVANLNVTPRDLASLRQTLAVLPELQRALSESASQASLAYLSALNTLPDSLKTLEAMLSSAIADDPPVALKQGRVIRPGYNAGLDALYELLAGGQAWLAQYEQQQRELTGLKTLKVSFNSAFGYYIEVSRAAAAGLTTLPEDWQRRQTLTNAERFISQRLREHEKDVINAQQQAASLEAMLFSELKLQILPMASLLKQIAMRLAAIDALQSLATVAQAQQYVRPVMTQDATLEIQGGRHPVLAQMMPMGRFVPNPCALNGRAEPQANAEKPLNCEAPSLLLITGPNMAGKSTYMRQNALIALMAQMGSYVPADAATIGLCDAVYTRIGAADDLTAGHSTFMVEMSETAQILNNATAKSLVILDEVGRGTSTYDGVAIAWSVADYLVTHIGCRTLFATHYHELNTLEQTFAGIVQNVRMLVAEQDGEIRFLHTVAPGSAQKSYGIQVAKMAGIPAEVVQQATRRLAQLHKRAATIEAAKPSPADDAPEARPQLSLF